MASKTYALLTDVHGNLEALHVALSRVAEHPNVDQVVFLGDYFALGPAPREVLQVLKEFDNAVFIRGNHERYIVDRVWEHEAPTIEGMSPDDPVCQGIVQHERWAAEQIGQEGVDFINRVTHISHREQVNGTLVEFSHAWYERDEQPPSLDEAITWRNHVRLRYPNIHLFLYVHGHIHLHRMEENGNLKILCPISTGLPFDNITKGAVAFLTVGNEFNWDVQRFDYNRDATLNLLEERKPPFYRNLQNTVKYAEIRNEFL